jgi:hypothetical protein
MIDYSEILLNARKHLNAFEEAMLTRQFKEAVHEAHDVAVEARLLTHLAREAQVCED